ncbi:MAG: gliding motility protein GldN [Bacteroidales bacterium]|nr:gliding motility protein GldN [Bacteroidales bacterium]
MKHIIRLIMLTLMLGIVMPEATAQVSVRRSSSSRSSSASTPKKKDKNDDKRKGKDATAKPTEIQGSVVPSTPPTSNERQTPTAVRRADGPMQDGAASPARVTPTRKVQKKEAAPIVDGNSQRQQSFAEYQRKEDGFMPWQHIVYRELDMENPINASLYYPEEPMDGLTNLFRVILDGICTNRLNAYEYLDGREIFNEKYEVKTKDILDKFQILYQEKPAVGQNGKPTYIVEEMDVPCNEVLSYFIKERWEFNQKTSKYGPRILAICPVMHRMGDYGVGQVVKYPMFWLNYEDLRPLLRDHLIMSDGMNNTPRFTMEEFFTLEQYKGDIYKVQNTRGLSLMQQYPDADTLKMMRAKIEAELRGFGGSIWVDEEDEADLAAQDSIRAARRAERRAKRGEPATASTGDGKKNRRTKAEVDMAAVEEAKEAKEDDIDSRIESTGKAHSARRSARR